mmetsp:Transcript_68421/g.193220  ORF Transcript_68421/g.193220 Transcript_68421/m.193220 type:complete len:285 (+) Transcript_68421:1147-2001(+)
MMITFAFAIAANSSPRLFVSDSKSSALVMHSRCMSPSAVVSLSRSLEVTPKSPSAPAFFSAAAAMFCWDAFISLSPNLISSVRDCFNISKACRSWVSFLRAPSSWSSAFSSRSDSTSTIPPLWPLYAAAAGVPGGASSSSLELCTKEARRLESAVLNMEPCTSTAKACVNVPAFLSWAMEAPPFLSSRSKMPIARWRVPTTSTSSFSSAAKSVDSFALIPVAALRSASSTERSPASFSTLAPKAPMVEASWAMAAFSSSTWPLPVLISKVRLLERSSHHSENSA